MCPQASETDRKRAIELWGDIDTRGPAEFLERRGYTLTKEWSWKAPLDHEPTEGELFAIKFLIHEWDFGGLEKA